MSGPKRARKPQLPPKAQPKLGFLETEVVKNLLQSYYTIRGPRVDACFQLWQRKKDDIPQVGVGSDTITVIVSLLPVGREKVDGRYQLQEAANDTKV